MQKKKRSAPTFHLYQLLNQCPPIASQLPNCSNWKRTSQLSEITASPSKKKSLLSRQSTRQRSTSRNVSGHTTKKKFLALQAEYHEQECNRTLTQSCQGTAISLEAFNKFYEEKRKSREYTEPCGALFGLNDPKKCDQEIYTRELCGLKRFFSKDSHCQRKTNQNYGCHRHSCWRSAIDKTEKWCYIADWDSNTETFDTQRSVYCNSAGTCGNELTTRPCATRNTSG